MAIRTRSHIPNQREIVCTRDINHQNIDILCKLL